MKTIELPSQEKLHELFEYREAPYTLGDVSCFGGLVWRHRVDSRGRPNTRYVGTFAGTYSEKNHRIQVGIERRIYDLARNVWVLHHGILPEGLLIDHADRNPLNNSIGNLRLADFSRNNVNRTPVEGASSRFVGVYFHRKRNKWAAQIKHESKVKYLGLFADEEDAARRRDEEAIKLFGPFALLNLES